MTTTDRKIQIKVPRYHPGQQAVVDEAARFNILQCGRRFGKTTLGEQIIINAALKGHPVAWFAPTYKTMAEQWKSIWRALRPVVAKSNKMEGQMELRTGGIVDFWSLDDPDSGRGRKYAVVVIDEASIIRHLQQAWEHTIRPTLTDLKGSAWFLGTPKGRNYFHQLFTKGQNNNAEGWKSWRLGSVDNPFLDEQEIMEARDDLPKRVFDQEYRGIPDEDAGNPFGFDAIRACITGELSDQPAVAYGVDLAKSYDWTVIVGLDKDGQVCHLDRWQIDWSQTRERVAQAVKGVPSLVDSTGVGDPIVEDMVRDEPFMNGQKFTSQSKQQMMVGLASAIQRHEIKYPEGWLVDELECFQFEYHRDGRVSYNAPSGLHDDGVCALALALKCWRERKDEGEIDFHVLGENDNNNENEGNAAVSTRWVSVEYV